MASRQPDRKSWWMTGEGVTLGAGLVNIALGIVKTFAGSAWGSVALMADGLHSFSDLATDVVVLVGYRLGRMPEDERHPYGHGRIETFATLVMGLVVGAVGVGLAVDAALTMKSGEVAEIPSAMALWAAFVSIIVKEGLFQWTAFVARDCDSRLILSNAWHHRTDAISSAAVVGGILASRMGFSWGDPLAAGVVGLFIIKVGWNLCLPAFDDLTDADPGEELLREVNRVIGSVDGVKGQHKVKARRAGAEIFIDADIEVGPELSVIQGHEIARDVNRALHAQIKNVRDTMIHVEPLGAHDGIYRKSVKDSTMEAAGKIALEEPDVMGVHAIRAIPLETGYLLNLDIELEPELTVSESHEIAHRIKERIKALSEVGDVVVHVDIHGE